MVSTKFTSPGGMWHCTQSVFLCADFSHVSRYGHISWQSVPQNLLLSVNLAASADPPTNRRTSTPATIARTLPPARPPGSPDRRLRSGHDGLPSTPRCSTHPASSIRSRRGPCPVHAALSARREEPRVSRRRPPLSSSSGTSLLCRTWSATLPSTIRFAQPCPCVAMAIRSGRSSSACCTMTCCGSPGSRTRPHGEAAGRAAAPRPAPGRPRRPRSRTRAGRACGSARRAAGSPPRRTCTASRPTCSSTGASVSVPSMGHQDAVVDAHASASEEELVEKERVETDDDRRQQRRRRRAAPRSYGTRP